MKIKYGSKWHLGFYIFIGSAVVLLIIFALTLIFLPTDVFTIDSTTQAIITPALQNQQKIEQEIQAAYKNWAYTLARPFIAQNPYGTAPLTALVIFDTPQPMQISIHIPGKTTQADVDYTFTGYLTHHEIPIYGLYAAATNQVTLNAVNQSGQKSQSILALKTESLPVYLTTIKIITSDPSQVSPGMNFTYLDHKEVYDFNGDIRWYSTATTFQAYNRLQDGHYLFSFTVPNENNNLLMEEDLLGKIYSVYNVPNGVQHDFAELPNGNLLVTTQNIATNDFDDIISEVDHSSGRIVKTFNLADCLDPDRPFEINESANDWLHMNSIVYDAGDQSIVISARSQSAVIKLSYPDLKVQWILGPHDNLPAAFQPYLLTPEGDNFEWQWSQHAATIISEQKVNGDEIMNLMLFDNGLYRSFDKTVALAPQDSYSRMVEYQIDETHHTVKQVYEYGKERSSELFSYTRGSAYLLANGNYFGTWSEILKDASNQATMQTQDAKSISSEYIEVNPTSNKVVYEAKIDIQNYRTLRSGLYDGYSSQKSSLSIKVNNTTRETPVKRAVTALQQTKQKITTAAVSVRMKVKHVLHK